MIVPVHIPPAFKRLAEKARIKVFYGGRGAAKSESVGRYLLLSGKEEPQKILCCREYQVSIRQSVHSLLVALITEMQMEGFYKVTDVEITGINGTKFVFAGLKNNIANIKSMHDIKRCWVEEAQVLSENSINVLLPTIRADESEIILTMNPILPTDPAYVRFVLNPPKDSIVVKVNYDQNPYFPPVLEKERLDLFERDPIAYRNVWLGEPRQAVEGAIYADELQKAQDEGRIGEVKYDPTKPVNTYWDIGQANYMSIWFEQKVGLERHLIDFVQDNLKKVPYYVDILQNKGYTYGTHVLPHDAEQDRANAEFTTKVMIERAFPNAKVHVNENFPGAIRTGIEAVRNIFPFLRFDKVRCADGIHSLRHYHFRVDPNSGKTYGEEPDHEFSDAADALRALAMAFRVTDKKRMAAKNRSIYSSVGV